MYVYSRHSSVLRDPRKRVVHMTIVVHNHVHMQQLLHDPKSKPNNYFQVYFKSL
jgi:hypothetical protein